MDKKRTKIVATISDKNCDPGFIRDLYEAGMDVIRINSAHLDTDGALRIIKNTREVSDRIAILVDTKGPEIRTTVCETPIEIKKGDNVKITGDPEKISSGKELFVSIKDFAQEVPNGSMVMISDGDIELKALRKEGNSLICKAGNEGIIGSRKSVNVPGVKICLPSVTDKDRRFIKMAVENNVDFIAHSFVRSKQDVLDVQTELDKYESEIKIIAKIENEEGVENLSEILEVVYGIMVARGDLAIEIP